MIVDLKNKEFKKIFVVGYGSDIDTFTEIVCYEDINLARKTLKNMKSKLPEFRFLDYRIEIFFKTENKTVYSGENIRI